MVDREPCGCKHDGQKWLHLCDTHREEHDARHAQAVADHFTIEGAKRLKEIL